MPSVLVVEDDICLRTMLVYQLEKCGVKADSAANGIEALRRVHAHQYALILMDCNMPEMDGIQATSSIRTYERVNGKTPVPIVAISAGCEEERALSAGMNAYFSKPLSLDTLQKIVDTYVPPEKRNKETA
jgi:two-component system, sensor histidine kinase and response regulator